MAWQGAISTLQVIKGGPLGLHHPCWDQEVLPRSGPFDGEVGAERKGREKRKPNVAQEEEGDTWDGNQDDRDHDDDDGASALVPLLKACAKQQDLLTGTRLHVDVVRKGLIEKSRFVGSTIVHMYANCGALEKSQQLFDELPLRDIISWTALVAGYAKYGHGEEALNCFKRMQHEGISPDMRTFSCILKACCSIQAANTGQEIHALIVKDCLLERNVVVANVLIDMYAKCGHLEKAQEVFDELPIRDVVSWTTLIAGYAQNGHGEEALMWFEQMQARGFSPIIPTILCVLKACGSIGAADKGRELHSRIVKEGLLEGNTMVANALVGMYAKCGLLADAEYVCDKLPTQDVITWNTLIGGYVQHGDGEEALKCFDRMQHKGFSPNGVTFISTLKACGMVGAADKGEELFVQIMERHLLEKNVVIANALVDMFSKCSLLRKAQDVFDKLLVRDVVSWNALIVGYGQQGQDEEALSYFKEMQLEGFYPDVITFACILKVCGSIGAADMGQEIHAKIVGDVLAETDMFVCTALVDMYAKFGMLIEAQQVFDKLPACDVVSWNVLIAGYSQLGEDEIVFQLLDKLIQEGEEPNSVTLSILLNTCSHRGLLDKGQCYFAKISEGYNIVPSLEHYTCMVDLFGRAGHISMAIAVIEGMSFSADSALWHTLLGACRRWGKMKLGRWAFGHAAQLEENDAAAYAYMGNIFAAAGRHEVFDKIETLNEGKEAW